MAEQSMVRVRIVFAVLTPWVLASCSSSSTGTPGSSSPGIDGGSSGQNDGGSPGAPVDAGGGQGPGDATTSAPDGGASPDGGALPGDGGAATIDGGGDGGIRDVGSCCVTQTTPGCSNASLEVCVCQMVPTCCTAAWAEECVLLVQQKYCQPGVRDCVCGADAGQWDQTSCCSTDWTSTCDSVATLKCSAVQGCF